MSMVLDETDFGGKAKIKKKVNEIDDNIKESLKDRLEIWWREVLNDAIALCPVDSGALQSSIRIVDASYAPEQFQVTGETGNVLVDSIIIAGSSALNNDGVPCMQYALAVHDGHVMRDGKSIYMGVPFLANALLIHEAELEAILSNATDEELIKVTEES